ncbi:M1 family aminopeptidase [Aquimarina sp. 2201CG5-10]|uniref:M1 family aminopeptidase n=1 Tax=Aquimarina callyspongiae TaxID=3098150 RepID=UPI002AB3D236|nr:M1 family aminopeptidase [Aquimarina sp. 2201CG5-10]MDY8136386.1 M1 family aminopeptidase [Aquimarina sp. 2201CG5-10]
MKKTAFLGLIFVAFLFSCNRHKTTDLSYIISPFLKDNIPMLKIQMSFKADPSGITKLKYQNNAWGEENIYNCIESMQLSQIQGKITQNKDSSWIEIQHPKNIDSLQFEYTLKQDIKDAIGAGNRYRPIINSTYFHVFSHNLFMFPKHISNNDKEHLNIKLNWNDFPEDYTIHNSFGSKKKEQLINDITEEEFLTAVFLGGDFRTYTSSINNNDVVLAIRGDWIPFEDDTIMKLLTKTVQSQRDFWQDHSQKYFTVTMMPIAQERGSSFGGTGLTNSFATVVSNNKETSIDQLVYLFNHELMHNWTGHVIKNQNEEEQYWFSEGFTEYYTFKNITSNKILNFDKKYFIDQMNENIKNLYNSPVGEKPNSEITYDNFWSDRHYSKLPYYRGALFAFVLDLKIQKDSNGDKSLNHAMRDFYGAAVHQDQRINSDFFIKTINKYTKDDITAFFDKHILKGELIDLAKIYNEFNLQYEPISEVFDLGFTYDNAKNEITTVDNTSAAYKKGIRVDDKLISRSIYYGRTDKKVDLIVLRNGEEIEISYYPVKKIPLPRLHQSQENKDVLKFNT